MHINITLKLQLRTLSNMLRNVWTETTDGVGKGSDDIRKEQPLGEQCAEGKNYFVLLAPEKIIPHQ